MFCPKCGKENNENDSFCVDCKAALKTENKPAPVKMNINGKNVWVDPTTGLAIKKDSILKKIFAFVKKHLKLILIITGSIVGVLLLIFLYSLIVGFEKLKWDEKYGDYSSEFVSQSTLNLGIDFSDPDKIDDVKIKTTCGDTKLERLHFTWDLSKCDGPQTVTVSYKLQKITKTVKVTSFEIEGENKKELAGMIVIPEEEDADNDNDGIINSEEKKLGTNINSADTDLDGLSDYVEINETKTDPLKKDSDGDGIDDGDELDLGLDPLKKDSKGDGVNDGDRDLTYTVENNSVGVTLEINGKGNIASSTIDVFRNTTFTDMDGILDKIFSFYSDGTIKSAKVVISYSLEEIQAKGLNEDNLTLYYFNDETKELEAVPTVVDKENKKIIVTLEHFSKYVIGDKNLVLTQNNTDIMFVIDNSVSMYSEAQMIDAGYNSSTGAIGNDTEFKRLTLTNDMIDMFTGNYRFSVAEFTDDYEQLIDFSDNKKDLKSKVSSMKSNWYTSAGGTNIDLALTEGISEFDAKDGNNHYLILLTDGKNNVGSLHYDVDNIISDAKDANVKICVIGLGTDIDTDDLTEIADGTGCAYYNANNASALDEMYSTIGANINYNYVDTDGDNKADGMIMANSGFLVNRDGFSFENFTSNKSDDGHCFGMALFARDYYLDKLPTSLGPLDNSRFYIRYFKTIDLSSNGYNLAGTYFTTGKNLYDFKISNEALKLILGELPSDYRDRVEDGKLMINKKYYDELEKIGVTFRFKKVKNNDFKEYQSALLTIDSDPFNSAVSKDESSLLNAIWRLFILQADAEKVSFSANPDEAFNKLYEDLSNGIPVVIGINGNHAINAIRLIQNIDDANKFKLEVYDNNYPGETRYIEVTRSKYSKFQLNYTAWTNDYNYQFSYDGDNDVPIDLSYPEYD